MNQSYKPTDKELEILNVLWKHGPSLVRDVNDILSRDHDIGYTTTLKQMQIMHEKGIVNRTKVGKSHVYDAAISEDFTRTQRVNKLQDTLFQGSAMKLVMHALGNSKSSPEELEQIKKYLDDLSGK